ncbi:hypothetical protein [Rhizobium etli]|nr:hypothetical protein [Rhizobium etli]
MERNIDAYGRAVVIQVAKPESGVKAKRLVVTEDRARAEIQLFGIVLRSDYCLETPDLFGVNGT